MATDNSRNANFITVKGTAKNQNLRELATKGAPIKWGGPGIDETGTELISYRNPIKSGQLERANTQFAAAHQYEGTPGEFFARQSWPKSSLIRKSNRRIDMRFEDDELADIGSVILRAMAKGAQARQKNELDENVATFEHAQLNLPNDQSSIQTQKITRTLAIESRSLGISIILIFTGLFASNYISGIKFIHPIIAIAFIITGATFAIMSFFREY